MNMHIIPKDQLNTSQLGYIERRIADGAHVEDPGPIRVWNIYEQGLYAAVDECGTMVALFEASGPVSEVSPGWWVDSKFRSKGVTKAAVQEFARYLKDQGYTGVGWISNHASTENNRKASQRLKEAFIDTFEHS